MKRLRIPIWTVVILLIASGASAAGPGPADDPPDSLVEGTILTISPITGDLLLSQHQGSVIVIYGIDPERLKGLMVGDRVTVRLGRDSKVHEVARNDL